MDELIELVSPEQLPEGTATRYLLQGAVVMVEPEGGRSWWFPELGVSLVQQEVSTDGSFLVSGHGQAGSFAEALETLREVSAASDSEDSSARREAEGRSEGRP